MKLPKLGMHYADVHDKLKRYESTKTNINMKNSLINQTRLHEGDGAAKELVKEFSTFTSPRLFAGVDMCKECHKVSKFCICRSSV